MTATTVDCDEAITTARVWIRAADRIVVLTGAGISTDSGIPDFRGPKGVWTRNPAAEKMATLQHYMADPDIRRQAWKARMATLAKQPEPNAGHRALVTLEHMGKLHTLVTQNVDGLHQAAGTSPERIVEIHGTIHQVMCMFCGERTPMSAALDRVRAGEEDPPCLNCGGILKSATISFGQALVTEDLNRATRAAEASDLLLAIGTTLSVFPVAGIVPVAKKAGARVVIVNAEPTEMDYIADRTIQGSITAVLGQLLALDA